MIELPETRLKRLQQELDELELELKMLEREEPSSHLFGEESDSNLQLKEVDFLRMQMRNVADSEAFKAASVSALTNPRKKQTGNIDEVINLAVDTVVA